MIKDFELSNIIYNHNMNIRLLELNTISKVTELLNITNIYSTTHPIYVLLSKHICMSLNNHNNYVINLESLSSVILKLKEYIDDPYDLCNDINNNLIIILDLINIYKYKLNNNIKEIITILLFPLLKGYTSNPIIQLHYHFLDNIQYHIWMANYFNLIPPETFDEHHWVTLTQ